MLLRRGKFSNRVFQELIEIIEFNNVQISNISESKLLSFNSDF